MELSKLKHLQRYRTPFELDYRRFDRQKQIQQLSITFSPKIEEIFETLETADIDITSSHSIIETIVNRNFANTLQHQNGPIQRQQTHKNTSQQHQYRNTSKKYQHRNTSKQYQPISFQIPRPSSITYLKEECIGCGLSNKIVREF